MHTIRSTRSTPAVLGIVTVGDAGRTYVLVEPSSFVEKAMDERRPLPIPLGVETAEPGQLDTIAFALAGMFIISLVAAYLRL
jgi:hypothetical protein